jgi:hypothetical protein
MIRTILLSTSYVDSKDIMLDFVERFIVWLRQFDGGNSYNDIYVMEYNIKSVNRPTSRFRKSIRYY